MPDLFEGFGELESETDRPPKRKAQDVSRPSYLKYYETGKFTDVIVLVGESAEEFNLHRVVLAAQSDYFDTALKESFEEGKSRKITIPDIESDIFRIIVQYLYTNTLEFADKDPAWDTIAALYRAADYLLMPALKVEISKLICIILEDYKYAGHGLAVEGLANVFEHATISDWDNIRFCTDAVPWCLSNDCADYLKRLIREGKDVSVLATVFLESVLKVEWQLDENGSFTR
ncbi:kelch-like [Arthrobotrys megalospora]